MSGDELCNVFVKCVCSPPADLCERVCGVKLLLVLSTVAAALLFPLLVWGGFELLPFEPPLLGSAPLRVVYTLRCSFFAIIPILLGTFPVCGASIFMRNQCDFTKLKPNHLGYERCHLVLVMSRGASVIHTVDQSQLSLSPGFITSNN